MDVQKVLENIISNNMEAYYVNTREDALEKVKELLSDCNTVSMGGSMTLAECKIPEYLRSGRFDFLDREKPGLSREQIEEIYVKTFSADAYLCSCNAITEDGCLYNVDGNCNRIAATLYGPKSVIMVAGINKIVPTLADAVKRVKTIAAPKNAKRLDCDTYCKEKGECVCPDGNASEGCNSDARICANSVIYAKQRKKNRIKVIIIGEEAGF